MAIVTVDQFRVRLGSPNWAPEVRTDAASILDEVEDELADMLQTKISPLPARTETAVILDTGLVCPAYPIFELQAIDGVDVTDPLPAPWLLEEGWLKKTDVNVGSSSWNPTPPDLDPFAPTGRSAHFAYGAGEVSLRYRPGWGDRPALRSLIMKVARARFVNRHDNTVVARDLTVDSPEALPEEITEDMLKRVGRYKWHHTHK